MKYILLLSLILSTSSVFLISESEGSHLSKLWEKSSEESNKENSNELDNGEIELEDDFVVHNWPFVNPTVNAIEVFRLISSPAPIYLEPPFRPPRV